MQFKPLYVSSMTSLLLCYAQIGITKVKWKTLKNPSLFALAGWNPHVDEIKENVNFIWK